MLQGRHLFAAETLTELQDWIRKIRNSLDQIRNNKNLLDSTRTDVKTDKKDEPNSTALYASKERKLSQVTFFSFISFILLFYLFTSEIYISSLC